MIYSVKGFNVTILISILFSLSINIKAQVPEMLTTKQGSFALGVNYWASHAGTRMWKDWRPEVVEKDFKQLSDNGIEVFRVFPLWPDFQPINRVYTAQGITQYMIDNKGKRVPHSGEKSDGMSEEQLNRFEWMTEIAEKYNVKLIVGLITGWMSGELYMPPALSAQNPITDAECLMWQQKFVTSFVNRFKDKPAILAWDFGNECNAMFDVETRFQAYVWSALLAGAIRNADDTRPLISGMHGLKADDEAKWRIIDQGALTDVLTTHPYSLWTQYASQDAVNTIRTIIHGAAETRLYADISQKSALVEETGVLGPMVSGEKEKAAFARTVLFSNWAHDCKGTMWWCAYDQDHLNFAPYDYVAVEAELGLVDGQGKPKQVLKEFKAFSDFLKSFPYETLPEFKKEAVCLLTERQDAWSVAYSSFILAKQAGFDFHFQKSGQELKEADLYLVPSIKGFDAIYKDDWMKLLEKVKNGATLYLSLDDAYLPTFSEPFGVELAVNIKRRDAVSFNSMISGEDLKFSSNADRKIVLSPKDGTTVLGIEDDGTPAFLKANYGKGVVYLLTFPLEHNLTLTTGAFDKNSPAYYSIYKEIAKPIIEKRIVRQSSPFVGNTEHEVNSNEKVVIMVNYSPEDIETNLSVNKEWKIQDILYGDRISESKAFIKANDAIVLRLRK